MRKAKVVAVVAAGLLTVSALGGTALAHWGPGNADAVYEKIAGELGSDQETVADAFATAADEARDAAIAEKLARLVENGVLTQEEADEVQAWYDSAPVAVGRLPLRAGHGRADLERVAEILGVDVETLTDAASDARHAVAVEAYRARLDEAVVGGRITQEQADEMLAEFESRVENGVGVRGFGHHGRGHHGGFGGMRGFGMFHAPSDDGASESETVETTSVQPSGQAA